MPGLAGDHHLWKGTIGKEGIGNINSNGVMLLSKCAQYDLTITNTLFRQKNKLKASWRHPHFKQWHLIDYVIVRARKRRAQKKQIRPRLNLDSLDETAIQQRLQASLGESVRQEYHDDIEGYWSLLKSTILATCKTIIGYKSRKHQDWFDENDLLCTKDGQPPTITEVQDAIRSLNPLRDQMQLSPADFNIHMSLCT
ncbi:hypothetical protein PO909_023519 [Leuciscus waleckii]